MALLALWRYLREQQRELSGSQFRKRVKSEYLHYLRVREWQDLAGELRRSAKEIGVTLNQADAERDDVHKALLTGLLSQIGVKDAKGREYAGARGARFALWPGSSLARKPPAWVMVAELVETSRLWGRDAAKIEPQWVEPLAEHLVQRTYSEPRWVSGRAQVVATERVTLYGLPIVTGRTVSYGRIDPELARELFIRRALVEGDWETRHEFFAANQELLEEVDALEQRARRRDIRVDDETLFRFYDERIPGDVVSGAHFDRWWRDARRTTPDLLTFTEDLLVDRAAAEAIAGRPDSWKQGELVLPLSYRFDPGSEHDGVTVHVPLKALPGLRSAGFDWLVPAFRLELVTELIRALPKDVRRRLVPAPEVAEAVLARLKPRKGRFVDAVARELGALRGVRVTRDDFDLARLPSHLRMTFRIEDEAGEPVAEGKDLDALREAARPRLRAELAQAARGLEASGLTEWSIGELPRVVALPGTGQAVRGYPALVDEGATAGVRVLETPGAQRAAMAAGTRRLLLLSVPSPVKAMQSGLSNAARLSLAGEDVGALLADAVTAALDALIAEAGGPAWDAAGFARLRGHVAGRLPAKAGEVLRDAVRVLDARREVERRLEEVGGSAFEEARMDVRRQLARLVPRDFVARTGAARLGDVERYLQGAARRLERLPDAAAVDRDRMRAVHELEDAYRRRLEARPAPEALREVPWMLEELRVSQFAQGLGTRGQVSAKRIRRALEAA
jgi:ATP-dependent helicase HrpA